MIFSFRPSRCAMNQRNKLEQLCRYITRPAIANERLKLNGAGDVVLQLKAHTRTGPNTSSYRRWISYNGWSTYGLFS